ncbi:hypothetical protein SAMN04487996_11223 [Dyadobacter soli]|uniref:Mannosyltransferase related to Gpi18 n=1 Tax=Dyadobacter soli TaxID=659014 RepID=A0A1G7NDY5_9BACT|nr:hypothetical protein SAMN04487996_11223 [Dyadobacter soli]
MQKPDDTAKDFFKGSYLTQCLSSDRRIFATSVIISFLVLLFTYPRYLELIFDGNLTTNYAYFFDKVKAPLETVRGDQETHGGKIDFRFTVPLLSKLLGIGDSGSGRNVILIYLIQSALLVPFLFFLMKLLLRRLASGTVLYFVMGISSIYLGKAFFWDYDFWFDAFAYFFLLLGMYLKNRIGIFLTLTLACWTDERAVIALAAVYLFHLLSETDFELQSFWQFRDIKDWLSRRSSIVLVVGAGYLVVRLFLSNRYGLRTPVGHGSGAELALIPYQLKHRLSGIYLTFEGLWLLFIAAIGLLAKRGNLVLIVSMVSIIVVQTLVSYAVYDISRSLTYAFPLMITAVLIINKYKTADLKYLYMGVMALCILMPTQYVIFYPRQIPWTILSYEELKPVISFLLLR